MERRTSVKPLITDELTKGLRCGGDVSTANARDATATSSDTSRTRTRNVCAPSARPPSASELTPEQGRNAVSESSEQLTVPPPATVKPKVADFDRSTAPSAGPEVMATLGAPR